MKSLCHRYETNLHPGYYMLTDNVQYIPIRTKGYKHWFDPYTSWKWGSPMAYRKSFGNLYATADSYHQASQDWAIKNLLRTVIETRSSVSG